MADLLFQKQEFTGASGLLLKWRLECDALSGAEIAEIARIAAPRISPFNWAIGIPRGGTRIAKALNDFAEPSASYTLVCDDVWTTGQSMRRFVLENGIKNWEGFVIFDRSMPENKPKNVWAMWSWGLRK